jgi:hypothetical protein
MKRGLCFALALFALAAPASACDRVLTYAPTVTLAVPVFIADPYAAPAATVLVAPVVEPAIVVAPRVVVPHVRVFARGRVRVFVRSTR